MQDSDQKLVRRCLDGDARAWEALVRLYSGRIYNMAYRYTHRFEIAQDLTQDIFLKVYTHLSSYRPESGALTNWIMRVGRNLIIDHHRATKWDRRSAGSEELETINFRPDHRPAGPYEQVRRREKSEILREGLQQLPFELREAVILRDIEELSYREIAQLLEIPEGTVKSRINRGRIELARVLRGRGDLATPVPPNSTGREESAL